MLIHGKERFGASLFSITVSALMHAEGNKILMFTAYPMAKEEFLEQVGDNSRVFYLENESDIAKASSFQTIIVQSGNIELFKKAFMNLGDISERVVFIKNIETICDSEIANIIKHKKIIILGDFDQSLFSTEVKEVQWKTKILFSSSENLEYALPSDIKKYRASMETSLGKKTVALE